MEGSAKIAEARRKGNEFLGRTLQAEAAARMQSGRESKKARPRFSPNGTQKLPVAEETTANCVPKRLPGAQADAMEDEPDAWTEQTDEAMEGYGPKTNRK